MCWSQAATIKLAEARLEVLKKHSSKNNYLRANVSHDKARHMGEKESEREGNLPRWVTDDKGGSDASHFSLKVCSLRV